MQRTHTWLLENDSEQLEYGTAHYDCLVRIQFDVIYNGGLVTARSNYTLKGYLSTFCKFVESKVSSPHPNLCLGLLMLI